MKMKREFAIINVALAVLVVVGITGSKCNVHSKYGNDAEISIIREALMLNNEVINEIDDALTDSYDGSDEAYKRLERGVCILESMQRANELAWNGVRIWELAKHDYQRKVSSEGANESDEAALKEKSTSVMTYLMEVAGIALLAYDFYKQWGKRPPAKLDSMIDLLRSVIGKTPLVPVLECGGSDG